MDRVNLLIIKATMKNNSVYPPVKNQKDLYGSNFLVSIKNRRFMTLRLKVRENDFPDSVYKEIDETQKYPDQQENDLKKLHLFQV
jgi:hypothetical protein